MRKWIAGFFLIFGQCVVSSTFAQLCNGSLSDPIISIDFGNGPSTYGAALSPAQTTYSYLATNNLQDGQYTITNSPNNGRPEWHNSQDHTVGDNNGYMLLVNASNTPGEFYRTRVTGLCENTIFEFSAWAMNALPPNICSSAVLPDLRFEIRDISGSLIAFSESGDIPESTTPTWRNFGVTFDIGSTTEVDVIIINNAPGGCGNDLAIDDIEFRACGDNADITSNLGDITPFCSDEIPASITLEAELQGNVYATPFYQWESSTDGANWSDISGAIDAFYTIEPIIEGMFYRYRVAGSSANITNPFCSVVSTEIKIEVYPDYEWQIDAVSTICDNQDLELLVTGTGTIDDVVWNLPNNNTTQGNPLVIESSEVMLGEYEAVVIDENGCQQTLVHELLTIDNSSTETVQIEECKGTVVQIGEEEDYTVTQTEEFTLTIPKLINSCDSIITYQITAFEPFDKVVDTIACYQSTILDPSGQVVTLTDDTIFNYSFISKDGCDSLVTKNITVPQPVDVLERVCQNETVDLPDGNQITASQNFEQTFLIPSLQYPTCDSIINFTLDVGQASEENFTVTGCPFQPVFLPNEEQTRVEEAGIYSFTFPSQNDCDSTINYIVNFDIDSCSYEDLCEIRFPDAISPNGNTVNDGFKPLFAPYCNYGDYQLTIFNRWGEKIYQTANTTDIWQPVNDDSQNVYLWHVTYTLILEDGSEKSVKDSGKIKILR